MTFDEQPNIYIDVANTNILLPLLFLTLFSDDYEGFTNERLSVGGKTQNAHVQ